MEAMEQAHLEMAWWSRGRHPRGPGGRRPRPVESGASSGAMRRRESSDTGLGPRRGRPPGGGVDGSLGRRRSPAVEVMSSSLKRKQLGGGGGQATGGDEVSGDRVTRSAMVSEEKQGSAWPAEESRWWWPAEGDVDSGGAVP
uniref:Uncharacterized protein n=1 Tax=Oryza barthii TaxID=65489 RepID=A0A0D3HK75_9ORYZ